MNETITDEEVREEMQRIRDFPEAAVKSLLLQATDIIMQEAHKNEELLISVGSAVNLIIKVNGELIKRFPKNQYPGVGEEMITYLRGLHEINKRDSSDESRH